MKHRALVIPVVGPVYEIEIPNDGEGGLRVLQEAVGGLIQAVPVPPFVDPTGRSTVYVNEEGKFLGPGWRDAAGRLHEGLPFNGRATDFMVPGAHLMYGDYIAGSMVVAGFNPNDGEHADIPVLVEARVRLIEEEAGG
jgi:hypothetical protein